jgi:phosphatidylethanolamine-binding protein (PEBP) family uncharacterized protein
MRPGPAKRGCQHRVAARIRSLFGAAVAAIEVVTNISPGTVGVGEGALPKGSFAGLNGFGDLGWAGPRPPVGDEPHRYFFRLYASDTPLGFGEGVIGSAVNAALDGHVITSGTWGTDV